MGLDDLDIPCPQISQHASITSPGSPYTPIDAVSIQKKKDWQADSTTIYFHVLPALIVDGLYQKQDQEYIDSLWNPATSIANGRELCLWALKKASVDNIEAQTQLRRTVGDARLKAGATRAALEVFMMHLWEKWKLITGNEKPYEFYQQLLIAMPTEPQSSHLTSVRTWISSQMLDYLKGGAPNFHRIEDAIQAIASHAKTIGLPEGDQAGIAKVMDNPQLFTIWSGIPDMDEGSDGLCGDCEDPSLNATGARNPSWASKRTHDPKSDQKKESECDFCDSFACKSRKHGGKLKCICRHDSKFNLDTSSLSRGGKRFVVIARAWHKANSAATTLKGVRFKVKEKEKTAPGADKTSGSPGATQMHLSINSLMGGCTNEQFEEWINGTDDGAGDQLTVLGAGGLLSLFRNDGAESELLVEAEHEQEQGAGTPTALPTTDRTSALVEEHQRDMRNAQVAFEAQLAEVKASIGPLVSAAVKEVVISAEPHSASRMRTVATPPQANPDLLPPPPPQTVYAQKAPQVVQPSENPDLAPPDTRPWPMTDVAERNGGGGVAASLLSPISKLSLPFSSSKSARKEHTSGELMARALAASEREKSKARVEASTPIRDAIIGKLNLIIGLIVRMGANLSAMQWATVLLAIKQVGPTLSPYVQRAIAYVVSLASSKVAKTIMEMAKSIKGKLIALLIAFCKRTLEYVTAHSAIRVIAPADSFLQQINRATGPTLSMLLVNGADDDRQLSNVQVVVNALNDVASWGAWNPLIFEPTQSQKELMRRLGYSKPRRVTYMTLHAVLYWRVYPTEFKYGRHCCAYFKVGSTSFYNIRLELEELLSTSAGTVVMESQSKVSTNISVALDEKGEAKAKLNIGVGNARSYSVGEAPALFLMPSVSTPDRMISRNVPNAPEANRTLEKDEDEEAAASLLDMRQPFFDGAASMMVAVADHSAGAHRSWSVVSDDEHESGSDGYSSSVALGEFFDQTPFGSDDNIALLTDAEVAGEWRAAMEREEQALLSLDQWYIARDENGDAIPQDEWEPPIRGQEPALTTFNDLERDNMGQLTDNGIAGWAQNVAQVLYTSEDVHHNMIELEQNQIWQQVIYMHPDAPTLIHNDQHEPADDVDDSDHGSDSDGAESVLSVASDTPLGDECYGYLDFSCGSRDEDAGEQHCTRWDTLSAELPGVDQIGGFLDSMLMQPGYDVVQDPEIGPVILHRDIAPYGTSAHEMLKAKAAECRRHILEWEVFGTIVEWRCDPTLHGKEPHSWCPLMWINLRAVNKALCDAVDQEGVFPLFGMIGRWITAKAAQMGVKPARESWQGPWTIRSPNLMCPSGIASQEHRQATPHMTSPVDLSEDTLDLSEFADLLVCGSCDDDSGDEARETPVPEVITEEAAEALMKDICDMCSMHLVGCDCTTCEECGLSDSPWQMMCRCVKTTNLEATPMKIVPPHLMMTSAAGGGTVPLPPGSLQKEIAANVQPALFDNGASAGASCRRVVAGMVPNSKCHDGVRVTVGTSESTLGSEGTWLFMDKRFGADGSGEVAVRQFKLTKDLSVPIVVSEGVEVYQYGYSITFDAENGRVIHNTERDYSIPLFMGDTSKLGWLKCVPVTDRDEMMLILRAMQRTRRTSLMLLHDGSIDPMLLTLGDGVPKALGMGEPTLRGVAFLRRAHIQCGHVSLRRLLLTLAQVKAHAGLFTADDVKAFAREGCGVCESAKAMRRSFTLQTITDKTPPQLGKLWTFDSLTLRVATAFHGYLYLGLFVEAATKKKFLVGMHGQTQEEIELAHNKLRAFVRPRHGEIMAIRKDSHPSHRSQHMDDYMARGQLQDQLSPGGVHEGVSDCEGTFMRTVPAANANLMMAPDLGEAHFFSALLTALAATDAAASEGTDPVSSVDMRYEQRTEWLPSPLLLYGSASKALVHPEMRDSKYDEKSYPCVYTGPAHKSVSPIHCSVWRNTGRGMEYNDVDLGCLHVDERAVIARTARDHPSHQPFGQNTTDEPVVEVDVSTWYDPSRDLHPADRAKLAATVGETMGDPPEYRDVKWVSSADEPDGDFTLGICAGRHRPGDIAGWVHHLSGGKISHVRVDMLIGAHEHNIMREHVAAALVKLAGSPKCRMVSLELVCGPFSVAKFEPGGPVPIFTRDHPDGVPLSDGGMPDAVTHALKMISVGITIASACLDHGGDVVSEHPVCRGRGSLYESKGFEQHSSAFETTLYRDFARKYGLQVVVTDQMCSGAVARKSTALLCSKGIYPHVQRLFGTLVSQEQPEQRLIGSDADGKFATSHSSEYTPQYCERLARCILAAVNHGSCAAQLAARAEGEDEDDTTHNASAAAAAAASAEGAIDAAPDEGETVYTVGDRVEVYWPDDKKWYTGVVLNSFNGWLKIKRKRSAWTEHVQVLYDLDGQKLTHATHNNSIRLAANQNEPTLHTMEAQLMLTGDEAVDDDKDRVFVVFDLSLDIETQEVLNKWSMLFPTGVDGNLETATQSSNTDVAHAHKWHTPSNERDFDRSPQRAMWQTAKELSANITLRAARRVEETARRAGMNSPQVQVQCRPVKWETQAGARSSPRLASRPNTSGIPCDLSGRNHGSHPAARSVIFTSRATQLTAPPTRLTNQEFRPRMVGG